MNNAHPLQLADEFNRYFTSANGVDVGERVSVPRDEWRSLHALLRASEGRVPEHGERSTWWALAMGAAASLEDASHCLRDTDARAAAIGAATHVRNQCKALWDAAPHPPAQQAEPLSMREALLKCKTCNLPTEVRELVNEALRGAPHKAEGAEPDGVAGILQRLVLATEEGDDLAQGTQYIDKAGKIRCKGSFLALIEDARAILATTQEPSA